MAERFTLKQRTGALIFDGPRFLWAMRPAWFAGRSISPWMCMRNRHEQLQFDAAKRGVMCNWQWTSDLHIAKVFPQTGRQLMKHALRDWPIKMRDEPEVRPYIVEVSFIIGHRGTARLSHLLATLQTIAAQRTVSFECIVVEQSVAPEIKDALPAWVRYVHTPLPQPQMPYCRSWAFNVAARLAQGELLVFHDNDMLLPCDYAAQLLARYREGYEVINLKRFIFYLNESHSQRFFSSGVLLQDEAPDAVVQNLEAGGSIAVYRDAFFAIGGFDEAFVGWGGEDNEFWERAQTRNVWPYTYLPIVHLWHEAQSDKFKRQRETSTHFAERMALPVYERIRELAGRKFGQPGQLDPPYHAADES